MHLEVVPESVKIWSLRDGPNVTKLRVNAECRAIVETYHNAVNAAIARGVRLSPRFFAEANRFVADALKDVQGGEGDDAHEAPTSTPRTNTLRVRKEILNALMYSKTAFDSPASREIFGEYAHEFAQQVNKANQLETNAELPPYTGGDTLEDFAPIMTPSPVWCAPFGFVVRYDEIEGIQRYVHVTDPWKDFPVPVNATAIEPVAWTVGEKVPNDFSLTTMNTLSHNYTVADENARTDVERKLKNKLQELQAPDRPDDEEDEPVSLVAIPRNKVILAEDVAFGLTTMEKIKSLKLGQFTYDRLTSKWGISYPPKPVPGQPPKPPYTTWVSRRAPKPNAVMHKYVTALKGAKFEREGNSWKLTMSPAYSGNYATTRSILDLFEDVYHTGVGATTRAMLGYTTVRVFGMGFFPRSHRARRMVEAKLTWMLRPVVNSLVSHPRMAFGVAFVGGVSYTTFTIGRKVFKYVDPRLIARGMQRLGGLPRDFSNFVIDSVFAWAMGAMQWSGWDFTDRTRCFSEPLWVTLARLSRDDGSPPVYFGPEGPPTMFGPEGPPPGYQDAAALLSAATLGRILRFIGGGLERVEPYAYAAFELHYYLFSLFRRLARGRFLWEELSQQFAEQDRVVPADLRTNGVSEIAKLALKRKVQFWVKRILIMMLPFLELAKLAAIVTGSMGAMMSMQGLELICNAALNATAAPHQNQEARAKLERMPLKQKLLGTLSYFMYCSVQDFHVVRVGGATTRIPPERISYEEWILTFDAEMFEWAKALLTVAKFVRKGELPPGQLFRPYGSDGVLIHHARLEHLQTDLETRNAAARTYNEELERQRLKLVEDVKNAEREKMDALARIGGTTAQDLVKKVDELTARIRELESAEDEEKKERSGASTSTGRKGKRGVEKIHAEIAALKKECATIIADVPPTGKEMKEELKRYEDLVEHLAEMDDQDEEFQEVAQKLKASVVRMRKAFGVLKRPTSETTASSSSSSSSAVPVSNNANDPDVITTGTKRRRH